MTYIWDIFEEYEVYKPRDRQQIWWRLTVLEEKFVRWSFVSWMTNLIVWWFSRRVFPWKEKVKNKKGESSREIYSFSSFVSTVVLVSSWSVVVIVLVRLNDWLIDDHRRSIGNKHDWLFIYFLGIQSNESKISSFIQKFFFFFFELFDEIRKNPIDPMVNDQSRATSVELLLRNN